MEDLELPSETKTIQDYLYDLEAAEDSPSTGKLSMAEPDNWDSEF